MRSNTLGLVVLLGLVAAGCTVKESEDASGDSSYEVQPANVEVGTDTATVKVPDVDIVPDTTPAVTTTN